MPDFRYNAEVGEMQDLFEREYRFSLFASVSDKSPKEVTLDDFVLMVEQGHCEEAIARVRAEPDKKARNTLKKNLLPAVTVSGLFSGGHAEANLASHSGLICLDFDGAQNPRLAEGIAAARDIVSEDEFAKAAFVSASGTGIAVICRIEPENHAKAFNALAQYFSGQYGLTADTSGSDVTRLRYLSHDEGIKTNHNARIFRRYSLAPDTTPQPPPINTSQPFRLTPERYNEISAALAVISPDTRDAWVTIGMALHDECPHMQGYDLWRTWSELNDTAGKFSEPDLLKNWQSFGKTKSGITISSLFKFANDNGWTAPNTGLAVSQSSGIIIQNAATVMLENVPVPESIVSGLIHVGELVEIVAPSKCRKSFFALQLGLSVATGMKFLNWPVPKPRTVTYFNIEIQDQWFKLRIQHMVRNAFTSCDVSRLDFASTRGQNIPSLKDAILHHIRVHNPQFVIIDPIYLIHGDDDSDQVPVKELLRQFQDITAQCKCALAFIHHDAKGKPGDRDNRDRGSGTNVNGRIVDMRVILTPHKDDPDSLVCIEHIGRNVPPSRGFTASFRDGHFRTSDIEISKDTSKTAGGKTKTVPDIVSGIIPRIVGEGPFKTGDIQDMLADHGISKTNRTLILTATRLLQQAAETDGQSLNLDSIRTGSATWYGSRQAIAKIAAQYRNEPLD